MLRDRSEAACVPIACALPDQQSTTMRSQHSRMVRLAVGLAVAACVVAHAVAVAGARPVPGSYEWQVMASSGAGTSHLDMGAVPQEFDCAWRKAALAYAQKLQPDLACRGLLQSVFDALQLGAMCNQTMPQVPPQSCDSSRASARSYAPAPDAPKPGPAFYCDAGAGSDDARGSIDAPFRTIQRAVDAARAAASPATVVLREGTFYLDATLELGPEDSGLTIQGYPGENAVVSGGVPITPAWKPYNVADGMNVYVADMSGLKTPLQDVLGLQMDGKRAILARYPNANPEIDLFPIGWISAKTKWAAPRTYPDPKWVLDQTPVRNVSTMFLNYMAGIGGPCSVFDPPVSYWCSEHPSGGGAFTYRLPTGLWYTADELPNAPYKNGADGALIDAWRPGHWANWFFSVDAYDGTTRSVNWTKGGFQGARGDNEGQEWYIANVFDELDSASEFFYNAGTKQLYFFYNGTGMPPTDATFVVPQLMVLINHTGTHDAPVKDISYSNVKFTAAATSIMAPHGVPSGGDWGLERIGALFFQGTVNTLIDNCTFVRVDGNALMLSGYNRNATVQHSNFEWIGNTAMAAWGYTHELHASEGLPDGNGINGADGNQPRGTRIINNIVHEIGLYEKQSSCWFQAKSAQTLLEGNICFNGPRAGFNVNDGFGGGNNITHNLLFNMCRETSDHGPFNSWDRQPFLTDVADPSKPPSLIPAYNTIEHNFMVANYGANGGCVDNDDGSSYYMLHHNFFVFGGHKSDFGGHNKISYNNINVYPQVYGPRCVFLADMPLPGGDFNEGYRNNTCVLTPGDPVYADIASCNPDSPSTFAVTMGDNKLYSSVSPQVKCGSTYDLKQWLAFGLDKGTTVSPQPSAATIIGWGQQLLGW